MNHFPFVFGIDAGNTSAGHRILDVGASVPFQTPDIKRIVEKTGSAIHLAANGCIAPGSAIWAENGFGVQRSCQAAWTDAGCIVCEDPANDVGFAWIDCTFAGFGAHVISIGLTARDLALEGLTKLPALCLGLQVREIEFAHRTKQADMELGDLPGLHCVQPDPVEGELVIKRGDITQAPCQSVEPLAQDHVE
ncbi:hypothetical protein ST40_001405 [Roseibium aggregatum]|nr:hypothetical protein [Roseibium aggregatum]UFI03822.1 hypothetical protein ST40_001405 [Roseibium aggregatum]